MRHQRKSPAFKFINSPWKSSVRGGITAKLLLTYQLCTNCQPWRLGVGVWQEGQKGYRCLGA